MCHFLRCRLDAEYLTPLQSTYTREPTHFLGIETLLAVSGCGLLPAGPLGGADTGGISKQITSSCVSICGSSLLSRPPLRPPLSAANNKKTAREMGKQLQHAAEPGCRENYLQRKFAQGSARGGSPYVTQGARPRLLPPLEVFALARILFCKYCNL